MFKFNDPTFYRECVYSEWCMRATNSLDSSISSHGKGNFFISVSWCEYITFTITVQVLVSTYHLIIMWTLIHISLTLCQTLQEYILDFSLRLPTSTFIIPTLKTSKYQISSFSSHPTYLIPHPLTLLRESQRQNRPSSLHTCHHLSNYPPLTNHQ